MRKYVELIKEICNEEGIGVTSFLEDTMLILCKDDVRHSIFTYNFDLNDDVTVKLCQDKFVFSKYMKCHKLPTLSYKAYVGNEQNVDYKFLLKLLDISGLLVLKPGMCRRGYNVNCVDNPITLYKTVCEILTESPTLLVCPYENIEKEYDAIILDGEIKLLLEKECLNVTGDGKSTVMELLQDKYGNEYFNDIAISQENRQCSVIPKVGANVELDWRYNVHNGAKAIMINTETADSELINIIKDAAFAIGARFITIEVIKTDEGYKVTSANCSSDNLAFFARQSNYTRNVAKEVYRDVIKAMFVNR